MENLSFPSEFDIIQKLKSSPKLFFITNFFFIILYIIAFVGVINIIYNTIQIKKKRINPIPSENNKISLNFSHLILVTLIFYLSILILNLIVRFSYKIQHISIPDELPYSTVVLIDLIAKSIITLFMISLINKLTHHPLKEIGFSGHNLFSHIKFGTLTIITMTPILLVLIFINSEVLRLKQVAPIVKIVFASSTIYTQIIMVLNILIISPIVEEIFFRYLLNGCLKREFGVWLSIFLGGMTFAALHFNPSDFLPITVLGIGLSYIYELKRSITIVVVAHSLFNLSSLIMLYIIKYLFQN